MHMHVSIEYIRNPVVQSSVYTCYILVCTGMYQVHTGGWHCMCSIYWYVHGMYMVQRCYSTRTCHIVQDPQTRHILGMFPVWASGRDPSEFSFLEIRVIGTWSWLVSTQFMSAHTALISRKLNFSGSWPDVQVSRYQEYTENLAYFGDPVLYDIISYHSIVLPCICMWV